MVMGWLDDTKAFINNLMEKAFVVEIPEEEKITKEQLFGGQGIRTYKSPEGVDQIQSGWGVFTPHQPGTPEFEKEVDRMWEEKKLLHMNEEVGEPLRVVDGTPTYGVSRWGVKQELMKKVNEYKRSINDPEAIPPSRINYGPQEILQHYQGRVQDPVKSQMLQQYGKNPLMIPGKENPMVNYFRSGQYDPNPRKR